MSSINPTEILLTPERELRITWSDGHVVRLSLQFLRDECPCAGCKGESGLLGVHYVPTQLPILTLGKYELKSLNAVGNYAIAATWGDGHDSGIYSYDYLLKLESPGEEKKNS